MSVAHAILLNPGQEKVETSGQIHPLGTLAMLPAGELFRYCFSNGAVTAGKLLQTAVPVAADDMDVAIASAAAINDRTISITTSGAIAEDLYKDGILYVNDGVGQGQKFRLGAHPQADSAATLVLNLATDERVRTALDTSSEVGLKINRYKDVIVFPTTATGLPVGFTAFDVADNRYFWAQVRGDAAILFNSTLVLGKGCIPGGTTAGSVDTQVDAGGDDPVVAFVQNPLGATTDNGHVEIVIE